jgi:hypothetical protein
VTAAQRTRVYCCLLDCDSCGAKRGEMCRSRGKVWSSGFHYTRSPFWRMRPHLFRKSELFRKYQALILQAESQGEIPGHE